jgi:hypothetical protein
MMTAMYYWGVVDWIMDGSISIPLVTMGRNFFEQRSEWYSRIQAVIDAATATATTTTIVSQDDMMMSSSSSFSNRAEDTVVSHHSSSGAATATTTTTTTRSHPSSAPPIANDDANVVPPSLEELYLYDGITIVQEWRGELQCQSLAFVMADSIPESPSDAYRRSWVQELQEALLQYS